MVLNTHKWEFGKWLCYAIFGLANTSEDNF